MQLTTKTLAHLDAMLARQPHLNELAISVRRAAVRICECAQRGGKVLLCGNGGSAADSEHIAGELMKSFILPRRISTGDIERLRVSGAANADRLAERLQCGVAAVALGSNAAVSTAIANDTDAALIFAQQVYVLGRPGDVLIGLSTSGNSTNVVYAMEVARAFGIETIGFTGSTPAKLDALSDVLFKAPETETFRIQECHLALYHTLCLMVEESLFGEAQAPTTVAKASAMM